MSSFVLVDSCVGDVDCDAIAGCECEEDNGSCTNCHCVTIPTLYCGDLCACAAECERRLSTPVPLPRCVLEQTQTGAGTIARTAVDVVKGEFVGEYVGERVNGDQARQRRRQLVENPEKLNYILQVNEMTASGQNSIIVDASNYGNVSCFGRVFTL